MSLYRAKPSDGFVWITGASSGIGRALAIELCSVGYNVVVTARSEGKLSELVQEAKNLNLAGEVIPAACDVTDKVAMSNLINRIKDEYGPISLAVLNAGIYKPVSGDALDIADFELTFDVNLSGIINGLLPLIDVMKHQGFGQIALVSSVAGYGGLPTSAAYGASKAALINMAESLKFDLDKLNIRLQLVNPGFVETAATDQNDFKMPAIVSSEVAAKCMADGFETGGFEITFPRRFTYFLKFINILPYWLYFPIVGRTNRK